MNIINALKSKNIRVKEVPKWGTYLRKQWEDNFASNLSIKEREEIHLYSNSRCMGYLWHLFSYEKATYIQGKKANKAFDSVEKNSCYIFYQNSDDVLILEGASNLSLDDLTLDIDFRYDDIYIVDKEFSWTYVKTHEYNLGPYFSYSLSV